MVKRFFSRENLDEIYDFTLIIFYCTRVCSSIDVVFFSVSNFSMYLLLLHFFLSDVNIKNMFLKCNNNILAKVVITIGRAHVCFTKDIHMLNALTVSATMKKKKIIMICH